MNAMNAMRPLTNFTANKSSIGSGFAGSLNNYWAVFVLIFVVFVAMVVYYKTIGYYLEFGWNKIYAMILDRESVEVQIGDNGISGTLKPIPTTTLPTSEMPSGMPGAVDNGGSLSSIGAFMHPRKEVFNVSRNIYKFTDAPAVCAALGAELATYEQVKDAYESGADWCNYGWIKGQMAIYPTQRNTYNKLQKGPAEYRNACGKVGINGGHFDNPDLAFGVNCYGVKPSKSATDELLESQVALPPTPAEIEFDKRVQKFRDQMNTITVLPFRKGQWSV